MWFQYSRWHRNLFDKSFYVLISDNKDIPKVLSHRQKQRAARRVKKKISIKEKRKELKALKKEENAVKVIPVNGFAKKEKKIVKSTEGMASFNWFLKL